MKSYLSLIHSLRLVTFRPFESEQSDEAAGMAEVDAGGESAEAGVLGTHLLVAVVEGEGDLDAKINMFSQAHLSFLIHRLANWTLYWGPITSRALSYKPLCLKHSLKRNWKRSEKVV